MSLINCPECLKDISDKVKSCPHCGYPFVGEESETQKTDRKPVGVNGEQNGKKKLYTSIVGFLLIAAIALGGYSYYSTQQTKEYGKKFDATVTEMMSSASKAEEVSANMAKLWFNWIWNPEAPETIRYTYKNGKPVGDVGDVLGYYIADSTIEPAVESMKDSEVKAAEMIKQLSNPPAGYKTSYATLMELQNAHLGLIDVVIKPIIKSDMGYYDGNYNHYINRRNQKIDEFIDIYEKLQIQLPNK